MTERESDADAKPRLTDLQINEAEMVKALGHPHRLRIAQMLDDGARPLADLIEEIGTAPSTVSTYLSVLRRAGLVSTYRVDGLVMYELSGNTVRSLIRAIRACLTDVTRRLALLTGPLHGVADDRSRDRGQGSDDGQRA